MIEGTQFVIQGEKQLPFFATIKISLMQASSFAISLNNTSQSEFLSAAKRAVAAGGGEFSGDDAKGRLLVSTPLGNIALRYIFTHNEFVCSISEKPDMVSYENAADILRDCLL